MIRVWPPSRRVAGAIAFAVLSLVVAAAAVALRASGTSADQRTTKPCWRRLLADWVAGGDLSAYPVHCYTAAQRNLPDDLRSYSTAPTDISRALQAAIHDKRTVSAGQAARTSAIVHHAAR